MKRTGSNVAILAMALAMGGLPAAAHAKSTACTKIGICYCVDDALKPAIDEKLAKFRATLADARKAGKVVGYMSVPLTSAGGGNFDVNREVADRTREAIEARFGAEHMFLFNPVTPEADLPRSAGGADYMLMWTSLLEGVDGLGEFDFAYFAGPTDFARYFGFDGKNDMAKLAAFYDARVKSNAGFAKAVEGGLTKQAFLRYYALRASTTVSRGAHDEWNIFRMVNERRRADPKLGAPAQIPVMFDGRGVNPADLELSVSEGYVGKCAM